MPVAVTMKFIPEMATILSMPAAVTTRSVHGTAMM